MNRTITTLIKRIGLTMASAAIAVTALSSLIMTPASALTVSASNDCDNNAVMYCGADTTNQIMSKYLHGDGHNTAASIQTIYNYFGIDTADVNALNTTAVAGAVTRGGNVYINGRSVPVASGATTAGRQSIQGSTTVTRNGLTFFVRKPVVSFTQASLPAFVVMKDGVFQFAIIANCGNPVLATPPAPTPQPKHPNYTINKEVAIKGDAQFNKTVTVPAGTHVIYRLTVSSTGDAPVQNMVIYDTLPAGATYVGNSFVVDGYPISDAYAQMLFSTNGLVAGDDPAGETDTVSFEAVIGADDTTATCKARDIVNNVKMTGTGLPTATSAATVQEICKTVPVTPAAVVTPVTPAKTLPNTGAGSVIGLFTAAAALAAFGYRFVVLRRVSQ